MTVESVLNPLVKQGLFTSLEEAARALKRNYILQEIWKYRAQTAEFEQKHGMSVEQFNRYTQERIQQLRQGNGWSEAQRLALTQAIMQDEQDWLEWKATEEILQSWLGLKEEPVK